MREFLSICDYFEITPQAYFDDSTETPELIQKAVDGMRQLSESDILILLSLINRLESK